MFFNPYYQVGVLHNNALDYVGTQVVGTIPTYNSVFDATGDYFASIAIQGGGVASLLAKANYRTMAAANLAEMYRIGAIGNYLTQGLLNEMQSEILLQILSIDRADSRNNYQDYFTSRENLLYGYSSLTEQEKVVLYCAVTVGKSSASYWTDQIANLGTSDWQQWIGTQQQGNDELPKWVKADIVGCVSGAIKGIRHGSWEGVITEAAAGAASASASEQLGLNSK